MIFVYNNNFVLKYAMVDSFRLHLFRFYLNSILFNW